MYPRVTVHHTRLPRAPGHAGPARFGSSAAAWCPSKSGDEAGRDDSTRLPPESPGPHRDAPTPAPSDDRATFVSPVVRVRTRDPVLGPLPIGLQAWQRPSDRFITHQTLRHPLLVTHGRRQGQCPHPCGLAVEPRRLLQKVLEAFTLGGIQYECASFGTIRRLLQALHPLVLKARMT